MRDDWDDEARRAYDQGYWDARRELEGKLPQQGRSRGTKRSDYEEDTGGMSRPWREESRPESQRMHPRQFGFEDRSGGRFRGTEAQRSDWRPDNMSRGEFD